MASEIEIFQYLRENEYIDAFIFLINSADNLRNRGIMLKNSIAKFEENIGKALERIEENPDVDPRNREMSSYIKAIHYSELEIIQRTNIMIELLAVYYNLIRTNLRELPKAIGGRDISSRQLYKEFEYFRSQTLEDIRSNLKYPNVESIAELSLDEKATLKCLLENSLQQIQIMFYEISEFQKKFRPVYNKYKHTLSEITGIYGINKEAKRLETQIYMRVKQDKRVQTYIVGAGSEILRYLREISGMAYELLRILIDSALLYLVNCGKNFIPRDLFVRDRDDAESVFQEIASKIKSCRVPNLESLVNIPTPNSEVLTKFNEEIQKHHIFIMNKDIMDPQEILRGGLTLRGKTEISSEGK